ncbi:MAG: prolyl-tRNA synthetase associated domain-containing protein [Pseudomonadota bacterium]
MSLSVRAPLYDRFKKLGIDYRTVDHPPIMTVDEGRAFKSELPGGHTKNLFLKDKKGGFFFLSAECDTDIDLVAMGKILAARGRLSFGRPEKMQEILGVMPGSVTPFALMNARPDAFVAVTFDNALFQYDTIWFHPLENTASTAISPDDLLTFVQDCGVHPLLLDFSPHGVTKC